MANAARKTSKTSENMAPSSSILEDKSTKTSKVSAAKAKASQAAKSAQGKASKAAKATKEQAGKTSKVVFTKRNAKIAGITLGGAALVAGGIIIAKNPAIAVKAGQATLTGLKAAKGGIAVAAKNEAVQAAAMGMVQRTAIIHTVGSTVNATISLGLASLAHKLDKSQEKLGVKNGSLFFAKSFGAAFIKPSHIITSVALAAWPLSKLVTLGTIGTQLTIPVVNWSVGAKRAKDEMMEDEDIREAAKDLKDLLKGRATIEEIELRQQAREAAAKLKSGEAADNYDGDFDWATFAEAHGNAAFVKFAKGAALPLSEKLASTEDVRYATEKDVWLLANRYVFTSVKPNVLPETLKKTLTADLDDMFEVNKGTGNKFAPNFVAAVVEVQTIRRAS